MFYGFVYKKRVRREKSENRVGEKGENNYIFFYLICKKDFIFFKNKKEPGLSDLKRNPKREKGKKFLLSPAGGVIFPPLQDIEVALSPKNLKFETCRASGAGGQHVNTTDSAVKVTYTYYPNST